MNKPIKVFDGFAGIGCVKFALRTTNICNKVVGYSEIDKNAIKVWEQNHNDFPRQFKVENYGDITKIDPNKIPYFDLFTAGFPCQAFSTAGKGLGEQDTRGTLFHDIIRICEVKKPKYILLENVKGLTTKTHKETFNKILSELDRIGYDTYWKVLNSKDYGIPQSRERLWIVCFRKDLKRKDFQFPETEELRIKRPDLLEKNVDEKHYLTEKQLNYVKNAVYKEDRLENQLQVGDVCNTVKAQKNNKIVLDETGRYRRHTPTENGRYMGFFGEPLNKVDMTGISDAQQNKLYGNGWTLRPASDILKQMFI